MIWAFVSGSGYSHRAYFFKVLSFAMRLFNCGVQLHNSKEYEAALEWMTLVCYKGVATIEGHA